MEIIVSMALLGAQVALAGSTAEGARAEPKLHCSCAQAVSLGKGLSAACKVVVPAGKAYLLASPLMLEGPKRSSEHYIYLRVGGERRENVLQYHQASAGTLDFPILFKPAVDIPLRDLASLVEVVPEQSWRFRVNWGLDGVADPNSGEWLALVKLMYLPEDRAKYLLREGGLTPVCRAILAKGLSKIKNSKETALNAVRSYPLRGYSSDGCRDVISREFRHLYSNTMKFTVVPAPGRGPEVK